jgi:hypothetical protein
MNDELVTVGKGAIMACLKIVSRHYSVGTEENHGNTRQNSRCTNRDSNRVRADYK